MTNCHKVIFKLITYYFSTIRPDCHPALHKHKLSLHAVTNNDRNMFTILFFIVLIIDVLATITGHGDNWSK